MQQKRGFGLRKPLFYPLNYGNNDIFDCRFSIADCKQRHPYLATDGHGFAQTESCRAFDSFAPAHSASGLPVYVARRPPAPFCELRRPSRADTDALQFIRVHAISDPIFTPEFHTINATRRLRRASCDHVPKCMKTLHRVNSETARVATALWSRVYQERYSLPARLVLPFPCPDCRGRP